jgi:flagellar basal body-associated protein FliL
MNKKVLWTVVVVILLVVVGYVGYWMGANKSSVDVDSAVKSVSDYLNQSEARFNVEDCAVAARSGYTVLDVGGKYRGIWDGTRIVGVCR